MDNPKDLSPLAKGEIELGKALPFAIYDRQGVLLLAAGQAIATDKQLEELSAKGLYHNPRWAQQGFAVQNKSTMGSVAPSAPQPVRSVHLKALPDDPTETGHVLKMNLPDQLETFSVRLVGALGKEAFVTSHPVKDQQFVFIKEGQVWEFRSFYGLSVYRFKAQVEKILLSPHPMLVMSWPQDGHLEHKPIRTTRRVGCELPATARLSADTADGSPINGVIRNLSTGGVEFEALASVPWSDGTQVLLAFQLQLSGRKYLLELSARVVVVNKTEPNKPQRFGMAFEPMDDADFAPVHAYVFEHLAQKLESPLYSPR
ncbi:flagellar brake protein [Limnobacter humi]|uniref:Flagellar brake protein n=1 Tax=Limnobacter humi TaxID=1778671 RepID=A0ABT1WCC8_9BURK|nr:flagellar brake protein [Limnobacter humi]MCQ8895170.1 flagellar brake protein [Limnobacter humi]